jgi:proteasome lid subunit RPN8/RPN11
LSENDMEIYIAENAFLGMILATVETFHRECMGLLVGIKKDTGGFLLQHAIPYQTATRRNVEVYPSYRVQKRMQKALANFSHMELIGDFHSHPSWGDLKYDTVPSEGDLEHMNSGNIYTIVSINGATKKQQWKYNKDGTISGSVNGYFLKVGAWYLDETDGKHRMASIRCPFALDLKV